MEWITEVGELVEIDEDLLGVVEEIRWRFPSLKVKYLDPNQHPDLTDAPYVIVDQQDNVVLKCWTLDKRVIDSLCSMNRSAKELLAEFELEQEAAKAFRARQREEEAEARKDLVQHVFKSPKGSYTFKNEQGEIIKVEDS